MRDTNEFAQPGPRSCRRGQSAHEVRETMPPSNHEILLMLFENWLRLAPELLQEVLSVELPEYTEIETGTVKLSEIVPTGFWADLVLVLKREEEPVCAILVEVQRARDERKRWSWPVYLATLRARYRCPACLLVFAADPAVARWCAQPIELGHPGLVLRPVVLSLPEVPAVTDPRRAAEAPELAVLSAMAHGKSEDVELAAKVGFAAASATRGLDEQRRLLYWDMIEAALSPAAQEAVTEMRIPEGYEYQSEFARKYFGRGQAEGRAEGRAEGIASSLMTFLQQRGIAVSERQRARILGCKDAAQLERWVAKAATASCTEELFGEE